MAKEIYVVYILHRYSSKEVGIENRVIHDRMECRVGSQSGCGCGAGRGHHGCRMGYEEGCADGQQSSGRDFPPLATVSDERQE